MNQNKLTQAIEKMSMYGENDDTRMNFTRVMVNLIKSNAWVFVPFIENASDKQSLCIVEMYHKRWGVIFSEEEMFKVEHGVSIVSTGVCKVIDIILNDDEIDGIAINPFSRKHAYVPKVALEVWCGKNNVNN